MKENDDNEGPDDPAPGDRRSTTVTMEDEAALDAPVAAADEEKEEGKVPRRGLAAP